MFTVLVVCRSRGYSMFLSMDDDILLSPAALAAMVAANGDASADLALRPRSEGGLGCSMVAPTLSTGIPTVPVCMAPSFASSFFELCMVFSFLPSRARVFMKILGRGMDGRLSAKGWKRSRGAQSMFRSSSHSTYRVLEWAQYVKTCPCSTFSK